MSEMTRRDALAGIMAMGIAGTETKSAGGDFAGGAKVFESDKIALIKQPNGAERRVLLNGTLATGEAVRVHESKVPEGTAAPALHVIDHSELIFVQEGSIEFVREGVVQKAVAGDIVYVAYGTNHCIRNAGPGTARYKVCAIGGDVKK